MALSPHHPRSVHLFVDFSNLWWSVVAEAQARGEESSLIRVDFDHLVRTLTRGEPVGGVTIVANSRTPGVVLRQLGSRFDLLVAEPGESTGREVAADEKLQNAMYRTIHRSSAPASLVLVTGDGAGWRDGKGFCYTLPAARQAGFGVELAAFKRSLNETLGTLAQTLGVLTLLDDHYEEITFLKGQRSSIQPQRPAPPLPEPISWTLLHEVATLQILTPEAGAPMLAAERWTGGNVDERWRRHDVAIRRAFPGDPLDAADLRAWIRQYHQVAYDGSTAPDHGTDAMDEALDRVGLRPERRARLVETIESFLARADSYLAIELAKCAAA